MSGHSIRSLVAGGLLVLSLTPLPCAAARPGHLIGALSTYTTAKGDNLLDVAQRFEVGYIDLVATNHGIDPWLPGTDVEILLPAAHVLPDAPRKGIVINLSDLGLYWFPANGKAPTASRGYFEDRDLPGDGRRRDVRGGNVSGDGPARSRRKLERC